MRQLFHAIRRLVIVFVRVGHVIYAQTMVQCAAFGCNNKSDNPGVEGVVEYTPSILFRSKGRIY